jgi:hypothetical protein
MTLFHSMTFRSALTRITGAAAVVCLLAGAAPFADRAPLTVDATSLDLKIENLPPREYPHMNYRSHVRFEDAAREWAAGRFMLTGNSVNTLRITIQKGDIVEELLPVKKGIKGWFTKDQSADYRASLELEVAIVDPNGMVLSRAYGKSNNSRSVGEGTTEDEKQQVWTGLIIAAFDALDAELQPQLRQAMAQYIR